MLVTGWGRVAKILALRLYALGALVTVAARKDGDRAMARALGLDSCGFDGIYEQAEEFDFVANTVPARVLEDDLLALLRPDAVLLELASPPGGACGPGAAGSLCSIHRGGAYEGDDIHGHQRGG